MKWVTTWRVEPPVDEVITVRFGSNVMFAAYSTVLKSWFHLYPGGEERIPKPPLWLCDEEYAATHQLFDIQPEKTSGRKKRPVQLSLSFKC